MILALTTAQGMLLSGLALLIIVLLRRYRAYFRKLRNRNKRERNAAQSRKDERPRQPLYDAPADLLRWQVEVAEFSRDVRAELDTKIGVLQAVIRLADERIAELQALAGPADETDGPGSDAVEQICELAVDLTTTAANAARSAEESSPRRGWAPSPAVQARIFQLADEGSEAAEIAERTGLPIGDVEILLSARPR